MKIDSELIGHAENVSNANAVKNIVLQRLEEEGTITKEQLEEYSSRWHVIIIKKSWFTIIKNKIKDSSNQSSYYYKFVKFDIYDSV